MSIPYYNILDVSQIGLKAIRQRPTDGLIGVIVNLTTIVVDSILLILTIVIFFEINGDIDKLAKAAEAVTTYSHMIIKILPLLLYRKRILNLFKATSHFWDPAEYPELGHIVKKTYRNTYFFLMGYTCVLYMTLIFFYLQPFFKLELLILNHVPEQVPYAFWIILVCQYVLAFLMTSAMAGFDSMCVAFFTHLVIQLKCLNYSIAHIDMKSCDFNKTLRKNIEHHRFILSFAEELLDIIAIPLLGQYMITTFLTCMELYLLSDSFGSPLRLILSVLYTTALLFQFGSYCFSATDFTVEAALLGEGAYKSRWHEGTVSQQKMISFIILRAQKEVKCTAAGLVEIDRRTFLAVIKTAVSFYTLMKQFKDSE